MKNRKIKALLISLFALTLTFSTSLTLSKARGNNRPEIVLAEGEEDPETPTSSEEPAASEEPATATPSESEGSEEKAEESSETQNLSIADIIINIFKDALKDLIEHFKRWFHLE